MGKMEAWKVPECEVPNPFTKPHKGQIYPVPCTFEPRQASLGTETLPSNSSQLHEDSLHRMTHLWSASCSKFHSCALTFVGCDTRCGRALLLDV